MKKRLIILTLYLGATITSVAQCEEPVQLPYFEGLENAIAPYLPFCLSSDFQTPPFFNAFETLAGPIGGFEGNVFVFDTAQFEGSPMSEDAAMMSSLLTPEIEFTSGIGYTVSFRYGNSNPQKTISMLTIELGATNIIIGEITNITGATAADYISVQFTPPSTGTYKINFRVYTISTQGLLYLDNIQVEETGVMSIKENTLDGLILYPNPVKDILTLDSAEPLDKIEVFNSLGQLVLSENPGTAKTTINLEGQPTGVYLLTVQSDNKAKTSRVIKE